MDIVERLKNLNFSAPAAERGLREYFYESESFKRLRNSSKSIILGNSGLGKSAIFKALAENFAEKNLLAVGVVT